MSHRKRKLARVNIAETLDQAEEAHLAGLPNADPYVRFAALTLDTMFFYIMHSATNGLGNAVASHLANASYAASAPSALKWIFENPTHFAAHMVLLMNISFFYLQTIFLVIHFGGSAAKLLIGLRVLHVHSGRKLTLPEAILREWIIRPLSLCSIVGAILAFHRRDHKTVHDLITHTAVKRIHGVR